MGAVPKWRVLRSSIKLRRRIGGRAFLVASLAVSLFLYCECLVYYAVVGYGCLYPDLESASPLKAMFVADTHLLGHRLGHWFDRLRREWQMRQSFAAAYFFFRPDVVFFLGDLFDEGNWSPPAEFRDDADRFKRLFAHDPQSTAVYAVAGNHDVGFHYATSPYLVHRFAEAVNASALGVELVSLKGADFVLVNSIAMHGDGCSLCQVAQEKLRDVARSLKGRRPILLQHFPLYRPSDVDCGDEPDVAASGAKTQPFREGWDSLSRRSSKMLLEELRPRMVVSGHTHSGCMIRHRLPDGEDVEEWSVASFSWRNRNNPNFVLAKMTRDDVKMAKCYVPEENSVIAIYAVGSASIVLFAVFNRRLFRFNGFLLRALCRRNNHYSHHTPE